ncbi:uncharacterized protein [Leuresthes tenuis]|uniref:uncharacterized protein n=1 Tax=Leuresthes tenuis TaxID=355514 RepID=UPI003B504B80
MMRTLCVAVIVLSLISVCQPASLTCNKLVKPVEKGPDLSGRWYKQAFSRMSCLSSTLFDIIFWASLAVDISSKDTPNVYDGNLKMKMYGYCFNESKPFFYNNSYINDIDSNDVPTGDPHVLLQTSCPDCIVVKANDDSDVLVLLSRRKVVTEAELKEFETQTECFGWSKPQMFNSDHDFESCLFIDEDATEDEATVAADTFIFKIYERLTSKYQNILKCIKDSLLYYFPITLPFN